MFLDPWHKMKRRCKSHLFRDLKPTHIAIDLGELVC